MFRLKTICSVLFMVILGSSLFIGLARRGQSEPSWARKYNSDCTLCHTIYPRLNRTGYIFRRLGYRFPAEVEKKKQPATVAHASLEASHPAVAEQETRYVPAPWSDTAAAGKSVVAKYSCATCHQIDGQGGRIGPSLDGVGSRRSKEFLLAHIQNPSQHAAQYEAEIRLGGELMPKVPATQSEVMEMVSFLLTLSSRPPAGGTPHPASSGQPMMNPAYLPAEKTAASEEGGKLYVSAGCSSCHIVAKEGSNVGPALDGIGARRTPVWLMRHITNPEKHIETQPQAHDIKTTMMPATELSPVEIAKIVDYLLTLPPTQQQEAASIPKNKLQDYFGVAYLPAVEMERSADESNNSFKRRELNLYAAGTLGNNFSFFVQPTPAVEGQGFFQHFEMIQGLWNSGGTQNFVQVRYGQIFNILNAGFGGMDRTITDSSPLLFQSSNGFNPRELGRGVSVEYTMKGLTTLKAFAVYQSPPEFDTESDSSSGEETPEARRSRTYGFTFEKVIGSKGLSGVQFQYVGGYTPVAVGQQLLPALHFQRYSFFANKAFQDKRNVERVNIIGGFMALRDNRLPDFDEPKRSRGYGFFIETNWIPVRRLGFVTRFDQLRASTLLTGNIIRSETAAVIYDFTKYTRMMFEFRHAERSLPTNLYRIGWQLNF